MNSKGIFCHDTCANGSEQTMKDASSSTYTIAEGCVTLLLATALHCLFPPGTQLILISVPCAAVRQKLY